MMGRWISFGLLTRASIHLARFSGVFGQVLMSSSLATASPVRVMSQGSRLRRSRTSVSSFAVGGSSRYRRTVYSAPASSSIDNADRHFEHAGLTQISTLTLLFKPAERGRPDRSQRQH